MQQQEAAEHRRRDRDPGVGALPLETPPPQPAGECERGQHQGRRQHVHRGLEGAVVGIGPRPEAPVPDRVRRQVDLAVALELEGGPPALEPEQHERQVHQHDRHDGGERHPHGAGRVEAPPRPPDRGRQLPATDAPRQDVEQQRQDEDTRVDLEGEPEREQDRGDQRPIRQRPVRAPPPPAPVHDVHGGDRAEHHRQVPVVEGVQHDGRSQRPDQGAPPGEPTEHPRRQQAEGGHHQRRPEQELGVVVGEDRASPDDHAGQHRVLDGAALGLPVLVQAAVEVREDVLVDVPAQPQVLDVGVADVAVDPFLVHRAAAPVLVELGSGAAGLVGVSRQQRQPAEQDHQRQPVPGEPVGGTRSRQPARPTSRSVLGSVGRRAGADPFLAPHLIHLTVPAPSA